MNNLIPITFQISGLDQNISHCILKSINTVQAFSPHKMYHLEALKGYRCFLNIHNNILSQRYRKLLYQKSWKFLSTYASRFALDVYWPSPDGYLHQQSISSAIAHWIKSTIKYFVIAQGPGNISRNAGASLCAPAADGCPLQQVSLAQYCAGGWEWNQVGKGSNGVQFIGPGSWQDWQWWCMLNSIPLPMPDSLTGINTDLRQIYTFVPSWPIVSAGPTRAKEEMSPYLRKPPTAKISPQNLVPPVLALMHHCGGIHTWLDSREYKSSVTNLSSINLISHESQQKGRRRNWKVRKMKGYCEEKYKN